MEEIVSFDVNEYNIKSFSKSGLKIIGAIMISFFIVEKYF